MSAAERWDARYAAVQAPFGNRPNAWLVACVDRWRRAHGPSPVSALLLADGDGRNGAWLAAQGTAVTAVDASAVATGLAARRDRVAAVTVRREVADLAHWEPPSGARYALAAVVYLQAAPSVRRRAIELAAASLAPGGWLVVEGFAARSRSEPATTLGPRGDERRYSLEALGEWSAPLAPRVGSTCTLMLDEGPRHSGAAWIVRFLAEAGA